MSQRFNGSTIQHLNPGWLSTAHAHLRAGGVLALPTETVYGFACAIDPKAVDALFALKGRPEEKALPWQVDTLERALVLGFTFSEGALRLARRFWPGPLTLVLPRPASCPAWFAPGHDRIALRIPDHPVALALLRGWPGALAVTSANRSGEPECLDAAGVAQAFAKQTDLLLIDGGHSPGGLASTVVDACGSEPKILRAGPISTSDILSVWRAG